ncbi:MAG TPA: ABC transporter permease [Gemmatimonadaceae bacterium]|nr:ABC transporter permease [Gemmatimonadaceae bacterium]
MRLALAQHRGWLKLDALVQDVLYSLRSMRRTPGLTAVIILTLGLGLGANGAVYAALDRLLIGTPPGIVGADRMRRLHQEFVAPLTGERRTRDVFSRSEFDALTSSASRDTDVGGFANVRVAVGRDNDARESVAAFITGDYFDVLGVRPALGRLLSRDEAGRTDPVVVLSHDLWSVRFQRRPTVLGETLEVGSHVFTIVGIAPRGFRGVGLDAADLWIPFNAPGSPAAASNNPRDLRLLVIARSASTAGLAAAQHAFAIALRELNTVGDRSARLVLKPISQTLGPGRGRSAIPVLTRLAGASLIILLLACANVANLLIVRTARRQAELAIRFALGISRTRILAQVATESTLLSLFAAAAAVLFAMWGGGILRNSLLPDAEFGSSAINGRVVAAITLVALFCGVVVSSMTLWYILRSDIASGLRLIGQQSVRGARLRGGLLMLQATLSMLLLAGAALFTRSLANVEAVPTGYERSGVVLLFVPPEFGADGRADEVAARTTELAARLRRVPGVTDVALSGVAPIRYIGMAQTFLPDRDSVPAFPESPTILSVVSPEYLRVMGIPLRSGRALSDRDRLGTEPVMLVSATLARQYWPGQSPIGKCVIVFRRGDPCRTVVGMVSDVTAMQVLEKPTMRFYLPLAQGTGFHFVPRSIALHVQPDRVGDVLLAVRQLASGAAGGGMPWEIARLDDLLAPALRPWRLNALLFSVLALLAVVVAGAGIFGTVAYLASERTREIGVRRSLGAHGFHIVRLVATQALGCVLAGIVVGAAAVLLLGRAINALLYQVSVFDPLILASAAALLLFASALACLGPVHRATRVAPTIALAAE